MMSVQIESGIKSTPPPMSSAAQEQAVSKKPLFQQPLRYTLPVALFSSYLTQSLFFRGHHIPRSELLASSVILVSGSSALFYVSMHIPSSLRSKAGSPSPKESNSYALVAEKVMLFFLQTVPIVAFTSPYLIQSIALANYRIPATTLLKSSYTTYSAFTFTLIFIEFFHLLIHQERGDTKQRNGDGENC